MKFRFVLAAMALFSGTHAFGQSQACGLQSLNGTYAFRNTGTIQGGTPGVFVGVETFDGKGNLSAKNDGSFGGSIATGLTDTGTYKVNPDCTGTMNVTVLPGVVLQWNFVIADNGKKVFSILLADGFTFSGEMVKQ